MSHRNRLRRLERLAKEQIQSRQAAREQTRDLAVYQTDPCGYARDVLFVKPWAIQEHIARLLLTPPYRVLVKASHGVGKTWLAAWLTSFWFDCMGQGGVVITTAPTLRDVRDLLWSEVRLQRLRAGLGGFRGDSACELYENPDHWAKGFTAAKGESFQGRHRRRMLFIFDEAIGVNRIFWQTTSTMFAPDGNHAWLAIFNPTDTTSEAYQQETLGGWHLVEMGSPEHPNLQAQLQGQPVPYPGAVTLVQFEQWLADWAERIPAEEATATDLQWPPDSGIWCRPGPEMEARALGRWPSQATYNVWSDALWLASTRRAALLLPPTEPNLLPQAGCDVARFGDDDTDVHSRWGSVSLAHERHNGWGTTQTTGRLVQIAQELAALCNQYRPGQASPVLPTQIPLVIDDDGVGGGVTDQLVAQGYRAVPVNAGSKAIEALRYPNRRSELWFATAMLARLGLLDLSRLDRQTLARLRQQAMAPSWALDAAGRRQVEPKHQTKSRLGRSPDGMDAVNLAYCPPLERDPVALGQDQPEPEHGRDPRRPPRGRGGRR